jgi:hypothetical protein
MTPPPPTLCAWHTTTDAAFTGVTVRPSRGRADWPETEVVRPPNHRAVEIRYHHLLIQQGLIPSRRFANRLADAGHPPLRGNRT